MYLFGFPSCLFARKETKFLHFLHQTSGCYFMGHSEKKKIRISTWWAVSSVRRHEHYNVRCTAVTKNGKIHVLYHSVCIKIRLCVTYTTEKKTWIFNYVTELFVLVYVEKKSPVLKLVTNSCDGQMKDMICRRSEIHWLRKGKRWNYQKGKKLCLGVQRIVNTKKKGGGYFGL